MGKLIQLLAILATACPTAVSAQSAENFNPELVTPTKPAVTKEEKAAAEAGPIPQVASRYAGAELDSYIASLSAVFSIRSRPTDPFCQSQDPTAKPPKPKVTQSPIARPTTLPTVKFSEVIARIPVTTVIPGEDKFLVGARSFLKGERFPIRYGARTYQVQILEVNARNILFRNVESGESGTLTLELMPQGMSKGNQGVIAPGMRPSRGDTPLELDNESESVNPATLRNN